MEKWLLDILTQFLLTPSPSGSEERVTALFAEVIRPYVDEITTDPNGNCIAHRKGKNGPVTGIIGKKPIHLQNEKEAGKPLSPEDLWIDIAATNKTDTLTKVQIGDVATFEPNANRITNDRIISKSLSPATPSHPESQERIHIVPSQVTYPFHPSPSRKPY